MKIHEKYLEALKTFDDFVLVSEWAIKVGELYPDLLDKANKEAEKQKYKTTGLRELSARISSALSRDAFNGQVQIDSTEQPRKVKYITKEEQEQTTSNQIEEDIEPLRRQDIINNAKDQMELIELYRIGELENIQKTFKQFFGIDFEIDHAKALCNDKKQGKHHPDNLQLLIKYHNAKKNKNSWRRFTYEEQVDYIKQVIKLQSTVAKQLNIEIDNKILQSLFTRLKDIY